MKNVIIVVFLLFTQFVVAQNTTDLTPYGNFEDTTITFGSSLASLGYVGNHSTSRLQPCYDSLSAFEGQYYFNLHLAHLSISYLNNSFTYYGDLDTFALSDYRYWGWNRVGKFHLAQPALPNCNYRVNYALKTTTLSYSLDSNCTNELGNWLMFYTLQVDSISSRFVAQDSSFFNELNYYVYRDSLGATSYQNANSLFINPSISKRDTNSPIYIPDTTNTWQSFSYITTVADTSSYFSIGYLGKPIDLNFRFYRNLYDSASNRWFFLGDPSAFIQVDSLHIVPIGYESLSLHLADTNLCHSNSININAYQPEFTHYEWSTGDTTANIQINNVGKYWLTAHYACGYLSDTFYVAPPTPNSLLPYQDTITICPLQLPYTLQADSLPNYLWSTGDNTRQIIAQSSGLYTIESTFYCGVVKDSVYIKIKEKEAKNLITFTDTLVCAKALPFAVEVTDTFQSYAWSNGATTAQNTFAQAGEYFVEVSDGCHTYQDTFRLQTEDLDTGVFVQQHFYCPQDFPINIDGFVFNEVKDTIFSQTQSNSCGSRTDSILLFVLPNVLQEKPSINIIDSCKQLGYYLVNVLAKDTNFSYQWESGNPLQFTTKGGETQQLIISNVCSTFKIDTFIAKCPEQIIFALPTAFSPNNDGVNDAFRLLYLNPDYELIDLSIFNRWGSQIFSTDKQQIAWQGKFQNENCPMGEYIYQLKLRHKTTSVVAIFSGSVLVVF